MIRKALIKVTRASVPVNKLIAVSKTSVSTTGTSTCSNCAKTTNTLTSRVNHQLCPDCAKAFDLAKNHFKSILHAHNVPAGVVNLLT